MAHRPLPADNLFSKTSRHTSGQKALPPVPACSSIRNLCYFPQIISILRHLHGCVICRQPSGSIICWYIMSASALPSHFPASSGASVLSSIFRHHPIIHRVSHLRIPGYVSRLHCRIQAAFSQTGSWFPDTFYGTGRCSRSHYISYLYMAPYQLNISSFFSLLIYVVLLNAVTTAAIFSCIPLPFPHSVFLHYLHTLSLCPISYSTNISKTALTGASFLCLINHQ